MLGLPKRFLAWYNTRCCTSEKLKKFTEFVFWLLRVQPHDARLRDGTDRFYLVMVLFSGIYMGLLSAALFFEEIPKELEYYLTSDMLSVFYIALAIVYTIAKEVQKRVSSVKKRRGGQFIVYLWTALALSFTILARATDRVDFAYTDPSLETLRFIAVISQAHVWGSRLSREVVANEIEKMINGVKNHPKGTAK